MKKIGLVFLCLFILGAGLRAVNIRRAVDRPSWRECDVAGIARNYYREDMNPFYPRVDWRGDGPGYTESEFPVYPWAIALLYKLFGVHEIFGRLISYIFSLLALWVFIKLARYLLPETGALAATLFFALSPLALVISTSLQPDGLMFLCYLLAAYAFIRWLDDKSWWHYGLALSATALALLAKLNAAHIGLLFAILIFTRMGWRALKDWRVWLFGVCSLLPSLLWYSHARHLWLTYGNSLGISNEYHWAGWDLFTNSEFIRGITHLEILYVWMPAGLVVVACGVFLKKSERAVKYSLYWLIAILAYYLIAARTTSDDWASYYHVVAVPPVALLIGAGVEAIRRAQVRRRFLMGAVVAFGALAIVLEVAGPSGLALVHSKGIVKFAALLGLTALLLMFVFGQSLREPKEPLIKDRFAHLEALAGVLAVMCLAATFLYQARLILYDVFYWQSQELHACARAFAPSLPANTLIVASGGVCRDPTNYPVAYNASYMFYWTDHKGFSICQEEQSVAALRGFARRGARYFIAEKSALDAKPGFEDELRKAFPLKLECDQAYLFELTETANEQK